MKFVTKRLVLSVVVAATYSTSALAGVILDTGPAGDSVGGRLLSRDQWLAESFTLDETGIITGVQGWLNGSAGTLRMTISSSLKGVPDTVLYTHDAFQVQGPNSWAGISGMNLKLDAGTYFATFEVPDGYTYNGNMPCCAPNPTPAAYKYVRLHYPWYSFPTMGAGLQVFGSRATDVPEPAPLTLLGLGMAGLALSRRKRTGST